MRFSLAALLPVLAWGCSNAWVRLPYYPRYPKDLQNEKICRILASRTAGIETLRAENVASTIETPEGGGSCHLILIVTREGSARIKGYARFFGKTVFDAVASPQKADVYVPSKGTVTTYRRRSDDAALDWAFGSLVRVLLANVPEKTDTYTVTSIENEDWLTVAVTRHGGIRELLEVDRRCLLVRKRTLLRDDATPGCIITYNRYSQVEDYWWPCEWEVVIPDRTIWSSLRFDPERLSFNRRFPSTVFVLRVPPDVERINAPERAQP